MRVRTLSKFVAAFCFFSGTLLFSFGYITNVTSHVGSSDYLSWTIAGLVLLLLGFTIHIGRSRLWVKRKSFYKL